MLLNVPNNHILYGSPCTDVIPLLKLLNKFSIENIYITKNDFQHYILINIFENNKLVNVTLNIKNIEEKDIAKYYKTISKNYNIETLKIIGTRYKNLTFYDVSTNTFDILKNNIIIQNILNRNENKISRIIEKYCDYDINFIYFYWKNLINLNKNDF